MNSHDYFMRQIEDMAQFLGKALFHKAEEDVPLFDEQGMPHESGLIYGTIKAMLQNGSINEAENLLFEKIEEKSRELSFLKNTNDEDKAKDELNSYLNVAVRFYEELSTLNEEWLLQCGFSRAEILDGLTEVKILCEEI